MASSFALGLLIVLPCCATSTSVTSGLDQAAYMGRFMLHPNGSRSFDWAASSVMISVSGAANVSILLNESQTNRYAVYAYTCSTPCDAVYEYTRKTLLATNSSKGEYVMVDGLNASLSYNLMLYKVTEPNNAWMHYGPALFQGFSVPQGATMQTPSMLPWLAGRRLEIIGDSITCCFGCTGSVRYDPQCDGQLAEDAWFSWGSVVARNLRSEYHLLAWSAIGLIHDAEPFTKWNMSTMVGHTLASQPDSVNNTWDFSWYPSAVLVNLGTNDGLPAKATQEQWIAAMLQLGSRYGRKTPVIVICGPWFSTGPVVDYNRAAVEAAREQGYDFHLYVFPSGTVQRNTTSCGGHPEADAQEAMGDQLTGVVQQLLGWDLGAAAHQVTRQPPIQTVV